jgi:hypothetical protein
MGMCGAFYGKESRVCGLQSGSGLKIFGKAKSVRSDSAKPTSPGNKVALFMFACRLDLGASIATHCSVAGLDPELVLTRIDRLSAEPPI